MQQVIDFLELLNANNQREWFQDNKAAYHAVQAHFNAFVEQLIGRIASFDPTVALLTAKDCTYRIYRDTRFSKNKTPYKTHMGAFICRGGKKSGYSGYYFQIGMSANAADFGTLHWETQHIVAPGHYCIPPRALQILREDIVYGEGDFDQIIRNADSRFSLWCEGALKRNPKGFDKDAPWSEYLRLKAFALTYAPDTAWVTSPHFMDELVQLFYSSKPMIDYVNRAIDYALETD